MGDEYAFLSIRTELEFMQTLGFPNNNFMTV